MFNHHPPYSPDLASSDFYLFLHLKKFLSGQHQRFQNDREVEMSVTQWFQSQAADCYNTGYKSWSHSMTNVQQDPRYEMSVTQWFQSQAADFYDTGYKSRLHGVTNVSIPEVDMLKNSSTLAVSVPINLSIKLDFVSVKKDPEKLTLWTSCVYPAINIPKNTVICTPYA